MTLKIYRWDEVFVKSESKKLKTIFWVSLPIDFSSHGYQKMLDEFDEESPSIYGAWCALLGVAAKSKFPGYLVDNRGSALTVRRIARTTGFPESIFERLLAWATDSQIGWLVEANTDFAKEKTLLEESPRVPPAPPHESSAPNNKQKQKQKPEPEQGHQQPTNTLTTDEGLVWLVGEIEKLNLDWEEAFAKLKRFHRRCGTGKVGNVVAAAAVLISMATDTAMEYDVTASIQSGSARKPEAFVKGAIGKAVEHLSISSAQAIEVATARMVFFNEQMKEAS